MNHTPTPWEVRHKTEIGSTKNPDWVANCAFTNDDKDVEKANAEFIVRACNSHDELVRAAKEAAVMLGEIAATLGRSNQQTLLDSPGFQKLINAINKAEGKAE